MALLCRRILADLVPQRGQLRVSWRGAPATMSVTADDVDGLSYGELQRRCKELGISARGCVSYVDARRYALHTLSGTPFSLEACCNGPAHPRAGNGTSSPGACSSWMRSRQTLLP